MDMENRICATCRKQWAPRYVDDREWYYRHGAARARERKGTDRMRVKKGAENAIAASIPGASIGFALIASPGY